MLRFTDRSTRECLNMIEARRGDIALYSDEELLQMDAIKKSFTRYTGEGVSECTTDLLSIVSINSIDSSELVTGIDAVEYIRWRDDYRYRMENTHTFSTMNTRECLALIDKNDGDISKYSVFDIHQFVTAIRNIPSDCNKENDEEKQAEFLVTIVSKSNDSLNTRIPYADYKELNNNAVYKEPIISENTKPSEGVAISNEAFNKINDSLLEITKMISSNNTVVLYEFDKKYNKPMCNLLYKEDALKKINKWFTGRFVTFYKYQIGDKLLEEIDDELLFTDQQVTVSHFQLDDLNKIRNISTKEIYSIDGFTVDRVIIAPFNIKIYAKKDCSSDCALLYFRRNN